MSSIDKLVLLSLDTLFTEFSPSPPSVITNCIPPQPSRLSVPLPGLGPVVKRTGSFLKVPVAIIRLCPIRGCLPSTLVGCLFSLLCM